MRSFWSFPVEILGCVHRLSPFVVAFSFRFRIVVVGTNFFVLHPLSSPHEISVLPLQKIRGIEELPNQTYSMTCSKSSSTDQNFSETERSWDTITCLTGSLTERIKYAHWVKQWLQCSKKPEVPTSSSTEKVEQAKRLWLNTSSVIWNQKQKSMVHR